MPITKEDVYSFKAPNDQGVWRAVGYVGYGDYGPRLSIIKTPLLMKRLEELEDGQRAYFALWKFDKDYKNEAKNAVEESPEAKGDI